MQISAIRIRLPDRRLRINETHLPKALQNICGDNVKKMRIEGADRKLIYLYDNLAFRTSFFYISQSIFDRFEWKYLVQNGTNDPGIDQRSDLA